MDLTRSQLATGLIGASTVLVFGLLALYLFLPSDPSGRVLLQPDDPAVVDLGRAVYAKECAGCHGANLEGQRIPSASHADGYVLAPPHDGTGHTWKHPDHVLFALTKYGTADALCFNVTDRDMPVFQSTLQDSEIIAALSFVKSRWPAEVRHRHDQVNALYSSAE